MTQSFYKPLEPSSGISTSVPMARNDRGIMTRMRPQGMYSLTPAHELILLLYQLGIYERIRAWELDRIDWMNKPGEIGKRYREMRKLDPEMQEIYRYARAVQDMNAGVAVDPDHNPDVYRAYPIMLGKNALGFKVTFDALISREMAQVALFYLHNDLEDPFKKPEGRPDEIKAKWDARLLKFELHPSTGHRWVYLAPDSGIPILLLGDDHAPRHFGNCTIELFDPFNWKHNTYLRSDIGAMKGDDYVNAPNEDGEVQEPASVNAIGVSMPSPEDGSNMTVGDTPIPVESISGKPYKVPPRK